MTFPNTLDCPLQGYLISSSPIDPVTGSTTYCLELHYPIQVTISGTDEWIPNRANLSREEINTIMARFLKKDVLKRLTNSLKSVFSI